jgi:hypothetical protein
MFLLMFRSYFSTQGPEFGERFLRFSGFERLRVPQIIVFHKINTLPWDRVRDDHGRHFMDRPRLIDGRYDLLKIMAVDLKYVPIE